MSSDPSQSSEPESQNKNIPAKAPVDDEAFAIALKYMNLAKQYDLKGKSEESNSYLKKTLNEYFGSITSEYRFAKIYLEHVERKVLDADMVAETKNVDGEVFVSFKRKAGAVANDKDSEELHAQRKDIISATVAGNHVKKSQSGNLKVLPRPANPVVFASFMLSTVMDACTKGKKRTIVVVDKEDEVLPNALMLQDGFSDASGVDYGESGGMDTASGVWTFSGLIEHMKTSKHEAFQKFVTKPQILARVIVIAKGDERYLTTAQAVDGIDWLIIHTDPFRQSEALTHLKHFNVIGPSKNADCTLEVLVPAGRQLSLNNQEFDYSSSYIQ